MQWIHKMKIAIYITAFLALCLSECYKAYGDEETIPEQDIELFWPPDMIPHPHVPEEHNPGRGIG